MDPRVISEIAEYLVNETGYRLPPNTPFVGRDFNLTRAGIHADGLLKDEEIYNIFDTELILNRPAMVSVTNTSGLAGIACWINRHFGLKGEEQISKKNPGVAKIKEWVDKQYDEGRVTIISGAEMLEQVRLHKDELPGLPAEIK
jgi:isopropylmalate/homocitrate/citramalate synthase